MLAIGAGKIGLLGVKAVKKVGQLGAVCGFARRTIATVWTPAESWPPPFHRTGLPNRSYLSACRLGVRGRALLCLPRFSPSGPQNDSVQMLLNQFARNTVYGCSSTPYIQEYIQAMTERKNIQRQPTQYVHAKERSKDKPLKRGFAQNPRANMK